ncbi:N-acetylgalactosamine-N,N'-diacetylbacillosaminyl-diphospho-undecaprenol 4-alpha-N-acetylgalactosaminyltransferase [Pricia antarctica]|uniref:N-acetylgalactosamine-N,N'-diacetylbacillosaminyl-diphospho-undecaprenol 4-alpha-N-acetylgalactosaminyltransferase n=1 Tax=Pricia antarctica TaxID=641691 RepID=A0A1G7FKC6_9FLAO|nr:glycosyltransferase [Pricia antarctica]SDE76316.1 N-acetylgalactosamine-N,N'-diacetylbacillosaminyl-diphospho-undecaprenol 4-alpha-N-acetylgalactosaminyltransferase [Pricia antarctica]
MNIAIFIYSMSGGGAERVVSYLLPYLKKQNHTVHLILMNTTMSYALPDDIPMHYLEKSKANENGIFKFLKLPFLAYKYAKLSKKLQLTHSFSLLSRPNYVNVLMRHFNKRPPKIIVSERNYASMIYGYGDMQSKINNFLVKSLYPKADLVIGNSKANVKDLVENYGIKKELTAVIENPIDLQKIEEIDPLPNFFDDAFFNMVSVGRFDPVKNQQLLIKALAAFPNARLYLLGKGILGNDLRKLVEDENLSDRVHFLGFDANPYKYLKSADLFVFGSNHEGFPNVLLEAMACGLPILTTNCKSGPDEIMELDKPAVDALMKTPYGILTPVDDVDLMAKGMAYFMENPEYLQSCKINVSQRIKAFEKEGILKAYEFALSKQ